MLPRHDGDGHGKMQGMSIVRALSHLVTQGPSKP
ncbi:esterase, partial [Bacilli bacterium]